MFEEFTPAAKSALKKAAWLARQDKGLIDPRHLLLGVLHEPRGVLRSALMSLGIDLETPSIISIRRLLEQLGARPVPADCLPAETVTLASFSLTGRRALELALEEANRIGAPYIAPSHLFLGVIAEGSVGASCALFRGVCPLDHSRRMVSQALLAVGKEAERTESAD